MTTTEWLAEVEGDEFPSHPNSVYLQRGFSGYPESLSEAERTPMEQMYCRFLRARKFVVKDAESMMRAAMSWRESFGLDALLCQSAEEILGCPERVVHKYFPQFLLGFDERQRPITLRLAGKLDVKSMLTHINIETFMRYYIWQHERCLDMMADVAVLTGTCNFRFCTLVDMDAFGWRSFTAEVREVTQRLSAIMSDDYPETMGVAFLFNSPWVFAAIWRIASALLDEVTKSRTRIQVGKFKDDEIFEIVDPALIPVQLGGRRRGYRLDPDFWDTELFPYLIENLPSGKGLLEQAGPQLVRDMLRRRHTRARLVARAAGVPWRGPMPSELQLPPEGPEAPLAHAERPGERAAAEEATANGAAHSGAAGPQAESQVGAAAPGCGGANGAGLASEQGKEGGRERRRRARERMEARRRARRGERSGGRAQGAQGAGAADVRGNGRGGDDGGTDDDDAHEGDERGEEARAGEGSTGGEYGGGRGDGGGGGDGGGADGAVAGAAGEAAGAAAPGRCKPSLTTEQAVEPAGARPEETAPGDDPGNVSAPLPVDAAAAVVPDPPSRGESSASSAGEASGDEGEQAPAPLPPHRDASPASWSRDERSSAHSASGTSGTEDVERRSRSPRGAARGQARSILGHGDGEDRRRRRKESRRSERRRQQQQQQPKREGSGPANDEEAGESGEADRRAVRRRRHFHRRFRNPGLVRLAPGVYGRSAKVDVPPQAEHNRTLMVREGQVLEWEFSTEHYDIAFSVLLNDSVRVPLRRLASHRGMQRGCLPVTESGTCVVVWSNRFSWVRGKRLFFTLRCLDAPAVAEHAADGTLAALRDALAREDVVGDAVRAIATKALPSLADGLGAGRGGVDAAAPAVGRRNCAVQ